MKQKIFLYLIATSFIVATLIVIIFSKIYRLQFYFSFILFALIFISLITVLDFIINKNYQSYNFNIKLILEMVTILVLFGQLIVLASQTNSVKLQTKILEQQKQILEESSLLNYPKIVITSLGYNCYNITKIYGKSEGRFDIAVTNIGKSAAPWVGVEFGKNQEKLIGTLEKDYFIELTSLNYIGGLVRFNLYDINISEFKFGKRNVIFKINCPLCKKVVDYQNITICIYKNTKEECGEYWTDCKENIIEN